METMEECGAKIQEALLTGRSELECLVMGNINAAEAGGVQDIVEDIFLQRSRPLLDDELPVLKSLKLPTKEEARQMLSTEQFVAKNIPFVHQEVAYNEAEENN